MYHIVNDKRAHKSADLIFDGLVECLKTKKFKDVTITDIQKTSYVSRSTFYRLFDTIDDVLVYKNDQIFNSFPKNVDMNNVDSILKNTIQCSVDNVEFFKIIFDNNKEQMVSNTLRDSLSNNSLLLQMNESSEKELKYEISISVGIVLGTISNWYNNGRKESVEELCDIIIRTINKMSQQL